MAGTRCSEGWSIWCDTKQQEVFVSLKYDFTIPVLWPSFSPGAGKHSLHQGGHLKKNRESFGETASETLSHADSFARGDFSFQDVTAVEMQYESLFSLRDVIGTAVCPLYSAWTPCIL